ncbi:MAG: FKBP-type peptidyl-prolyl cis-trans isomerase [Acidobacteria bacterium]|nr:FKBP-type peptidyl-prolyl cis-trans isomerase [Acidobacteriota bacterium]
MLRNAFILASLSTLAGPSWGQQPTPLEVPPPAQTTPTPRLNPGPNATAALAPGTRVVPPAPAPASAAAPKAAATVTTPSGLKYVDTVLGKGDSPKKGQACGVHYNGWLYENGQKGKKFDSSIDRGQPFQFTLGAGQVIKGWDEGVSTMKKGGWRTLIIPANLGYGAQGAGGVIPPNATLIFDVELVDFR